MMEFVSWDDEIPNVLWKNKKWSKPPIRKCINSGKKIFELKMGSVKYHQIKQLGNFSDVQVNQVK